MAVAPGFMGFPSVGGSLYQTDQERRATDRANDHAEKLAAGARDWQKMMSDTAHQREVKDLIAAGLNPILSVNQGAMTPSGSTAQTFQEDVDWKTNGEFATSALDKMRLDKEIRAVDSQTKLNELAGKAQEAAAQRDGSSAKRMEAETKALQVQMPAIQSKARADKVNADFEASKAGQVWKRFQEGSGILNNASSILRVVPKSGSTIPKGSTLTKNSTGEVLQERP